MVDDRIQQLQSLLPQCLTADWVRIGRRLSRVLRDAHHSEQRDALLDRFLAEAKSSIDLRSTRQANIPQISYPPNLPITARREEIVRHIRDHQVVVIAGETGSGKTTQIPKMCLEAGFGIEAQIGCTQPRRIAALSISKRISEELNVDWGREIGCKIRFDDRSSPHTYIKMMTDGILLAEAQSDPILSHYNCIIIDEAHERSLNIDFLLGHLKNLIAKRADLKLIITSATIDTESFSRHFGNAPIIEVSGRVFPVDVHYAPLNFEEEDISMVDAAVRAVEKIVYETATGDVLVFMPGERDIRECSDQLEGRFGREIDVIPMFGRLSAGDQQRVFTSSNRRKIVVATNIAETSLTIPGVRYVIDSGLARISRYNPRTRIKRLPIEPISQSSANQRKGRAGRVEEGICIRLYAEEDFNDRPAFTQPEIQRANLAEVILRMKAFRLGDIETFPFVQPPAPAAIANGYALLRELGALDEQQHLTSLGEALARLPIDPTLGRMLLQSQREHAASELLIIASGLSIQDPRERPLDQKESAAAAHQVFADPRSDFLALLNIWRAVDGEWDKLRTQGNRRKFCKQRFLSYVRIREWRDLHSQLYDSLSDLGTFKLNESNAAYEAIHRSILVGLVGHVAHREDRNIYKMAGQKEVSIFPGSSLYARGDRKQKFNQPPWIVAGEIVETSQLFARTVAGIDPAWVYQLAPHCCKVTHRNPQWNVRAGNVLAEEVVTLHGLEVQRRKVDYGQINSPEATALFIRSALVEEQLLPHRRPVDSGDDDDDVRVLRSAITSTQEWPAQYSFLTHNRRVRDKIENWRTRVRDRSLGSVDEALAAFYARHITDMSSIQDLNGRLRDADFREQLCVTDAELAGGQSLGYDANAFPDSITIGGQPVPVTYAYAPGEEHDGATIELPFTLAQSAAAGPLEWSVPGLRAEMTSELLRALPKSIRRELMPFPPKVEEIVIEFQPAGKNFLEELASFLHRRYGVEVKTSDWPASALPSHMRPRIEVLDHNRARVDSGRDLAQLQQRLSKVKLATSDASKDTHWIRAAAQWEKFGLTGWTFEDLPERITLRDSEPIPVYAWPGLEIAEESVNLRLFQTRDQSKTASTPAVQCLLELALGKDFAWLEKDLRGSVKLDLTLREMAFEHLKRFVLSTAPPNLLTKAWFDQQLQQSRERMRGLGTQFLDRLTPVLQLRDQIRQRIGSPPAAAAPPRKSFQSFGEIQLIPVKQTTNPLAEELASLLPERFLEAIPYERLVDLPRYLKALLLRIERAGINAIRNQERMRQLAPYTEAFRKLKAQSDPSANRAEQIEAFRWMVEEFKVSLFAQELGTSFPVSSKRLDQQLELIRSAS